MDSDEIDESFCDRYIKGVTQHMQADGSLKIRSEEFHYLTGDTERLKFALNLHTVHNVMTVPVAGPSTRKSSELSIKYRNEGNVKFQEKDYKTAWRLYTKSVIMAPSMAVGTQIDDIKQDNKQTNLALAYANRSAALFHLQQHSECLQDITRAFITKYPQDLHYKLYDRQAKCLLVLKQCNSAITAFENAKNSLSFSTLPIKKRALWEKDIGKALQLCKELGPCNEMSSTELTQPMNQPVELPSFNTGPGKRYTSLSDACNVKYSETAGRFVVAEGNIAPGDVVLIEKPFASVLLEEHCGTHCHHCFVRFKNPVACQSCTLAVFCGEECRDVAGNSYHKYECEILHSVYKSGVGKFGHLALRTVTVKGGDFFQQFKQSLSKDTETDADFRGSNSGEYNSQDYHTIYNLVGHSEQRAPNDLFIRTLTATFLLKSLQKTTFFNEKFAQDEEFLVFIGGLILKHLQSFPCNAHEISELVLDKNNVATSTCQELGAGIYATLSLFNHSCNPVATRFFYGNTCVVRSLKPTSAGDEISDNYGAVYAVHTKAERQAKLKPQYYFSCNCNACKDYWPLYEQIACENPSWLCSQCKHGLSTAANENVQKFNCKKCGVENNLAAKRQALKDLTESYYSGLANLLECSVDAASVKLQQALSGMHKQVQLPWRDVNNAEEALKQCFNCMANCYVMES